MVVNYSKLRTGDMVVCGGRGAFAALIRWATRRKQDKKISVHTGLVVEWAGQFFIAEMLGRGLTISPFKRYEKNRRRWILAIRRHSVYDKVKIRRALLKRVALDYRRTISYDWKGCISFVFKKCKDNKNKNYCSEYFYEVTKLDGIPYPKSFEEKVGPPELQEIPGWKDYTK
jgi:hypothetical protein